MIKNRLGLENVPCWFASRCDGGVEPKIPRWGILALLRNPAERLANE